MSIIESTINFDDFYIFYTENETFHRKLIMHKSCGILFIQFYTDILLFLYAFDAELNDNDVINNYSTTLYRLQTKNAENDFVKSC